MKKQIYISFVIIFSSFTLFNVRIAYAHMGSMLESENETVTSETEHEESVETILQEILNHQNVSTIQELDLSKVSDEDWERLGDAVMELQHPGEAHEAMDQMMGGEGSESLKQMHINMGKAYLGYSSNNDSYKSGMMGGMMGFNNNSIFNAPSGMMGFGSMMGYGAYGGYGILGAVVWILAITFFASGTYFFLRSVRKK